MVILYRPDHICQDRFCRDSTIEILKTPLEYEIPWAGECTDGII